MQQTVEDSLASLEQAIEHSQFSDRPNAAAVVTALLQAEQSTRKARRQFPLNLLLGDWRLLFSTIGKVKLGDKRLRGFYLPTWIPAQISFHQVENAIEITNQITIGPVHLKLTGPAKYGPTRNLLGFDFTQLEARIFGQKVYAGAFPSARKGQDFAEIAIGKLPFFAFFEITDRFIAARGRGGGLAIWVKQD